MLVQAGMNLTREIMWKLITSKKKVYLDSQVNALVQNTRTKEKQLDKLQMSTKEQTGMEVRNVAQPIVHSVAQKLTKESFDIEKEPFF